MTRSAFCILQITPTALSINRFLTATYVQYTGENAHGLVIKIKQMGGAIKWVLHVHKHGSIFVAKLHVLSLRIDEFAKVVTVMLAYKEQPTVQYLPTIWWVASLNFSRSPVRPQAPGYSRREQPGAWGQTGGRLKFRLVGGPYYI